MRFVLHDSCLPSAGTIRIRFHGFFSASPQDAPRAGWQCRWRSSGGRGAKVQIRSAHKAKKGGYSRGRDPLTSGTTFLMNSAAATISSPSAAIATGFDQRCLVPPKICSENQFDEILIERPALKIRKGERNENSHSTSSTPFDSHAGERTGCTSALPDQF